MTKSGLMTSQKVTLTSLWATKEFTDLWIVTLWTIADWLLLLETLQMMSVLMGENRNL